MTEHKMTATTKFTSGAVLWKCDECHYAFILQVGPMKKIILNHGDQDVSHGDIDNDTEEFSITVRNPEYDLRPFEEWADQNLDKLIGGDDG